MFNQTRFKAKYLTKKQKDVINDFFTTALSEQEILDKWHLRWRTYYRWHQEKVFSDYFNERLNFAGRQHEFNFTRYSSQIDARLLELIASQKDETARKACMDMIKYQPPLKEKPKSEFEKIPQIPQHVAGRIFEAMVFLEKQKKEEKEKQNAQKNQISPSAA